jgi:cyclase
MVSKTRVIPVLLLRNGGLVKTVKFKDPKYVGDPINAVRIFNEKEVDELVFLDISATPDRRGPDFETLADIASEAFMPMAYGGGISSLDEIKRVLALGFEKVILNSSVYRSDQLIREASAVFGSQSIVCCIDVKRSLFGKAEVYSASGKNRQSVSLEDHVLGLVGAGAGEILVNSIDRDGTMSGYDLKLISQVARLVRVPLVVCGGAGGMEDLELAVRAGASAVAAGSLFVFYGPHRAVLINYPERAESAARLP